MLYCLVETILNINDSKLGNENLINNGFITQFLVNKVVISPAHKAHQTLTRCECNGVKYGLIRVSSKP